MKNIITILLLLCFEAGFSQNLIFSNSNLKTYLLTENSVDLNGDEFADTIIDLNNDNEIQLSEALLVENLIISPNNGNVTSIQDIHQFTNLKRLTITGDFGLTDISNLALDSLQHIRVSDHFSITNIDLSDLPNLTSIYIEGLTGVQHLNLQNGSYATDAFSLFYTYVQSACVDSIADEYNVVAQHLVNGGSISTNCSLGITESHSAILEIYPNPSDGVLNISQNFESAELYDISGNLVKEWEYSLNKIDVSFLDDGVYLLKLKLHDQSIIEKKIIKK